MQYHHRTVSCPHCGKTADYTRTVDSQKLIGSPFRMCPSCKQIYFDEAYKEMGIELYNDKGGLLKATSILSFLLSNGLFIGLTCMAAKEGFNIYALLSIVLFGIFAFVVDFGLGKLIYHRINKEEYHQKQIDYIEGRGKKRSDAVIESMERLSDKSYLDALVEYGVSVPDYFYTRATKGFDESDSFLNRVSYHAAISLEEEQKKAEHEKEDLEKLLQKQKIYRSAQRFLALGIHNKDFIAVAEKVNMSPQEFKSYCKKTVEEYEAMHREYNLTHSTPAPMLTEDE